MSRTVLPLILSFVLFATLPAVEIDETPWPWETPEETQMRVAALKMGLPDPVHLLVDHTVHDEQGGMIEQDYRFHPVDLLWLCKRYKDKGGITPAMVAEYRAKGFISEVSRVVRRKL